MIKLFRKKNNQKINVNKKLKTNDDKKLKINDDKKIEKNIKDNEENNLSKDFNKKINLTKTDSYDTLKSVKSSNSIFSTTMSVKTLMSHEDKLEQTIDYSIGNFNVIEEIENNIYNNIFNNEKSCMDKINEIEKNNIEFNIINEKYFNDKKATACIFLIANKYLSLTNSLEIHQLPFNTLRYCAKNAPQISLEYYLARIVSKYNKLVKTSNNNSLTSDGFYVLALGLIYLDKLLLQVENLVLNVRNIHRLFLTCCFIAQKYLDDYSINSKCFAYIGGIPTDELNTLELRVAQDLKFGFFVKDDEVHDMIQKISNLLN